MDLLQKESKLEQVVKLVGADVLPDTQRLILDVCNIFKNSFLQQSAFDKIDAYSTVQKQVKMLRIIVTYYRLGNQAIQKGATLAKLKRMRVYSDMTRMKFSVANDETFRGYLWRFLIKGLC